MAGYDATTLFRAKKMRRDPTDAEKMLWKHLRGQQLIRAKFRRQQPIGPYIVDFVCQERRLIVEADGGQHHDSDHDASRNIFLTAKGYRVIRFWNNDLLGNIFGVIDRIADALQTPHPPIAAQWAPPSPSRGEGFEKEPHSG